MELVNTDNISRDLARGVIKRISLRKRPNNIETGGG